MDWIHYLYIIHNENFQKLNAEFDSNILMIIGDVEILTIIMLSYGSYRVGLDSVKYLVTPIEANMSQIGGSF